MQGTGLKDEGLCAPVLIGTYTRFLHLKKTTEALALNSLAASTDLYIASDAARTPDEWEAVENIRRYISKLVGFKSVTLISREKNLGSSANYREAANYILSKHDRIIVMEDDIVTGREYLRFINDGLNIYDQHSDVFCVSGYMWANNNLVDRATVALPVYGGWGSGFHKDNYNKILYGPRPAINALKNIRQFLNLNFAMPGIAPGLLEISKNRLDAWDINCFVHMRENDKYCLFPARSLVRNIGFDGSGTHCGKDDRFTNQPINEVELATIDGNELNCAQNNWKITFRMFGGTSTFFKGIALFLLSKYFPEKTADLLELYLSMKNRAHNFINK